MLANPPASSTGHEPVFCERLHDLEDFAPRRRCWPLPDVGLLPRRGARTSGSLRGCPGVAERGTCSRDPAESRAVAFDLSEQDRISWSVGDVGVANPTVQVENAVIVRCNRCFDVVMAAGIIRAASRLRTGRGASRY